jgi:hypothetical protein
MRRDDDGYFEDVSRTRCRRCETYLFADVPGQPFCGVNGDLQTFTDPIPGIRRAHAMEGHDCTYAGSFHVEQSHLRDLALIHSEPTTRLPKRRKLAMQRRDDELDALR